MFQIEENKIRYQENNDTLGFIEFVYLDEQTIDIIHTFVEPKYRGKGIGKKLLEYALNYFEEKGLTVKYSCSYVKEKVQKNQYND